ncbi:hypothetical protein [Chitinimonas arctica]|uniref:hypothetical protein n=1 Tax=Chitinimonas arctica TaxID=2594795 RepID=UPI003570BD81
MMTIAEMLEQRGEKRAWELAEQRILEREQRGLERGLECGRQKLMQVARDMLETGMEKATVMKITGLDESDLKE